MSKGLTSTRKKMLLFSFLSFKSFFFRSQPLTSFQSSATQAANFSLAVFAVSRFPILFQAVAATTSSASCPVSYGERRDF